MPTEDPMNDVRDIWQRQQTTGGMKMAAAELHDKAQKRYSKARFETLYSILIGVVICVFFGRAAVKAGEFIPRLGLGVLSLCGVYFAYQAYRWVWPGRRITDAPLETTLLSYKSDLEKRRDYVKRIWHRAGLSYCFVGLALVIVPGVAQAIHTPRRLVNFAPVLLLLVVWCAIFFPKRKRDQRKLQQEIDELDRLVR